MAKTLISSSPPFPSSLPTFRRHGRRGRFLPPAPLHSPHRRLDRRVKLSFQEIPPLLSQSLESVDLQGVVARVEGMLYTLADAAVVAADPGGAVATATDGGVAAEAVQKNGGWFGFISEAMEVVLKVLKDGLTTVHIPYAYGFAIILLTVVVKVLTLPLTKQQVESTLAMQNLQPKIKAIQQRYAGNQHSLTKHVS